MCSAVCKSTFCRNSRILWERKVGSSILRAPLSSCWSRCLNPIGAGFVIRVAGHPGCSCNPWNSFMHMPQAMGMVGGHAGIFPSGVRSQTIRPDGYKARRSILSWSEISKP